MYATVASKFGPLISDIVQWSEWFSSMRWDKLAKHDINYQKNAQINWEREKTLNHELAKKKTQAWQGATHESQEENHRDRKGAFYSRSHNSKKRQQLIIHTTWQLIVLTALLVAAFCH